MTEIGTVRQLPEKHVSRVSPQSEGDGAPASAQFLGTLPTPKRFDLERPNFCDKYVEE